MTSRLARLYRRWPIDEIAMTGFSFTFDDDGTLSIQIMGTGKRPSQLDSENDDDSDGMQSSQAEREEPSERVNENVLLESSSTGSVSGGKSASSGEGCKSPIARLRTRLRIRRDGSVPLRSSFSEIKPGKVPGLYPN
jgi:hypothetical protein